MARPHLLAAAAAAAAIGACSAAAPVVPKVALHNAAAPGQMMPYIGLGTGGYGSSKGSYNAYPECWMEIAGCGAYTVEAVSAWLQLGGRRLDAADSYDTQYSVGVAMAQSGIPRDDIFLLQKIGNWNPMGYNDTLSQFYFLLEQMNVSYVDITLNHWPTSPASPTVDPLCDPDKPTYDKKGCRLSTWKALVEIWQSGKSLAIGVANYGIPEIEEIIEAQMPLPAVNQVPYHLYNAGAQQELKAFCEAHNIVLLAYSPLGIPDWHAFPTPALPSNTTLTDPVVLAVAAAHAPATPAEVILAWLYQQNMPSNPRTMNVTHMAENLGVFASGLVLTDAEMKSLSSRPIDYCDADQSFYECVPAAGFEPAPAPWRSLRA
jgi:diketogulonate reductase-like aldo/keto reductase